MKKHSTPTTKLILFLILLGFAPFLAKADTHTVTFHIHGATGEQTTEQGSITARLNDWDGPFINSGDQVEQGATIMFETSAEPSFRVRGWFINGMPRTGIITGFHVLDNLTADTEITVEFEEIAHTVTFNVVNEIGGRLIAKVGDVEIQSGARVRDGSDIVFTATPDPGFSIRGWHNGGFWSPSTDATFEIFGIVANRTIRVEFEGPPISIHTVTFNSQGGSNIDDQTVEHGETIERPTDPTRENYIFEGWYINTDFTTAWDFATCIVISDTTLFARWKSDETTNIVVETLYATSLQVFPNPVVDQLHITHNWQSGDIIELFNINGRRIFSATVGAGSARPDGNTFTIDMTQFPTGTYILRIGTQTTKIIKQ